MLLVLLWCSISQLTVIHSQRNSVSALDQMVMDVLSGVPLNQVKNSVHGPKHGELMQTFNNWVNQLNTGKNSIIKSQDWPPPIINNKAFTPNHPHLHAIHHNKLPKNFPNMGLSPTIPEISTPDIKNLKNLHVEHQFQPHTPPAQVSLNAGAPNEEGSPSNLAKMLSSSDIGQVTTEQVNLDDPNSKDLTKIALDALTRTHEKNMQELLKSVPGAKLGVPVTTRMHNGQEKTIQEFEPHQNIPGLLQPGLMPNSHHGHSPETISQHFEPQKDNVQGLFQSGLLSNSPATHEHSQEKSSQNLETPQNNIPGLMSDSPEAPELHHIDNKGVIFGDFHEKPGQNFNIQQHLPSSMNIEQTIMKAFPEDLGVKTLPPAESANAFDISSFLKKMDFSPDMHLKKHLKGQHQLLGHSIDGLGNFVLKPKASNKFFKGMKGSKKADPFADDMSVSSQHLGLDPNIMQQLGLQQLPS